jgi:hypothetical protein
MTVLSSRHRESVDLYGRIASAVLYSPQVVIVTT